MHPSILKIKSIFKSIKLFDFNFASSDGISKIITSLDSTKKTSGVITTKIVKLTNKGTCKDLANCINQSIKKNEFPNEPAVADITLIFKKQGPLNKENYRPISVLPRISKIFERVLLTNLQTFQISFFLPFCVLLEKGIALNMHS